MDPGFSFFASPPSFSQFCHSALSRAARQVLVCLRGCSKYQAAFPSVFAEWAIYPFVQPPFSGGDEYHPGNTSEFCLASSRAVGAQHRWSTQRRHELDGHTSKPSHVHR